jgi:uncharacterized phiE125 gp8 family phage protein
MSLHLITAPLAYPVSLQETKSFLRVDAADEDATILSLIASATAYLDGADGIMGRALVEQTWELRDCEFGEWIAVPLPP